MDDNIRFLGTIRLAFIIMYPNPDTRRERHVCNPLGHLSPETHRYGSIYGFAAF